MSALVSKSGPFLVIRLVAIALAAMLLFASPSQASPLRGGIIGGLGGLVVGGILGGGSGAAVGAIIGGVGGTMVGAARQNRRHQIRRPYPPRNIPNQQRRHRPPVR